MNYEYKFANCRDLFPPVDRSQVLALATSEKWILPQEYIEFLLEHNGMKYVRHTGGDVLAFQCCMDLAIRGPIGFTLPFASWPQPTIHTDSCGFVDWLFGVQAGSFKDLRSAQSHYDFKTCVPSDFLAIGGSDDMNRIVLAMSGEWQGKIFRWPPSPDPDWPEEQNTLRRLFFVANSFKEFWDGLAEVPSEIIEE